MSNRGRKEWIEKGYEFYNNIRPYYCKHCGSRYEDWDNFYAHITLYKKKIKNNIEKTIGSEYSEKAREDKTQVKLPVWLKNFLKVILPIF